MRKSALDLSFEERQDIYLLRSQHLGIREISRRIDRSASVVSRELSRFNQMNRSWRRRWSSVPWYEKARYAHELSVSNRSGARNRGWGLKNERIRQYVYEHIKKGWSPRRIALRIRIVLPGESISHEAIYNYIFTQARELIVYLKRCRKKGRRKRSTGKKHRAASIAKRCITERPNAINNRKEFGHNESDLIVSAKGGKSCLLVFVERKTRRTWIRKVKDRKAGTVRQAISELLHKTHPGNRLSLTVDNGKEHEWLPQLEVTFKRDGLLVYYCNPYSAWERGTVEAINGVIRNKYPKGTNFDLVSEKKVEELEAWINSLPMECHKGYTMLEAYKEELQKLQAE